MSDGRGRLRWETAFINFRLRCRVRRVGETSKLNRKTVVRESNFGNPNFVKHVLGNNDHRIDLILDEDQMVLINKKQSLCQYSF